MSIKLKTWSRSFAGTPAKRPPIRNVPLLKWKHLCAHLSSLSFTAYILFLALTNKQFAHPDDPNLNSKLNAMQFVARLHEAMLTLSLGWVMIDNILYEMCEKDGVPYGLSLVAYQLSSPEIVFSQSFWAMTSANWRNTTLRRVVLQAIAFIAVVLTAIVGPSSAILLVPQVHWQAIQYPFGNSGDHSDHTSFFRASYDGLYPAYIDSNFMPKSCDPSVMSCAFTCPNAGMSSIGDWGSMFVQTADRPNITITTLPAGLRSLIASNPTIGHNNSLSLSTIPMLGVSRLLRKFWAFNQHCGSNIATTASEPRIELKLKNGRSVMQPVVQVQCSPAVDLTNRTQVVLDFSGDRIRPSPVATAAPPWPEHVTINTSDWTARPHVQVAVVDIGDATDTSHLGFLVGQSFINFDVSRSQTAVRTVMACTVHSRWLRSSITYQPGMTNNIFSNIFDPGRLTNEDFLDSEIIHVDPSFVNALNVELSGYTLNNYTFTVFEYIIRHFYVDESGIFNMHAYHDDGMWQWIVSTAISTQMTEALSRIQAAPAGVVWLDGERQAVDFTSGHPYNDVEVALGFPPLTSIQQMRNASDSWTEVEWKTEQYVYGWSLNQIPSYMALSVLCCHTIISLSHIVLIWFRRWQCESWENLLQFVALAIQSPPTEALKGTATGMRSSSKFAEPVKIRESMKGNGVVVTVGDDGRCAGNEREILRDRHLVSGKLYT